MTGLAPGVEVPVDSAMEFISQYSDTLRGSEEDSMDEDDAGVAMDSMTSRRISAPSAAPDVSVSIPSKGVCQCLESTISRHCGRALGGACPVTTAMAW